MIDRLVAEIVREWEAEESAAGDRAVELCAGLCALLSGEVRA